LRERWNALVKSRDQPSLDVVATVVHFTTDRTAAHPPVGVKAA
jgi:hypothetical protein